MKCNVYVFSAACWALTIGQQLVVQMTASVAVMMWSVA